MEAILLRVKDIDFGLKQITVRSGKRDKDRMATPRPCVNEHGLRRDEGVPSPSRFR